MVQYYKNAWRPGEVVTMVANNGAREGVLWRITKVQDVHIWIEPLPTLTGPSVMRPRRVKYYEVNAADLVVLCSARAFLDTLIADLVRHRMGEDTQLGGETAGAPSRGPGPVDG